MDTKTLLEQANEHVVQINKLMGDIEEFEGIIGAGQELDSEIAFFKRGMGTTSFIKVLSPEKSKSIKNTVLSEIIMARNEKTTELEKLLSIRKPAVINPEFEQAVREMEEQHDKAKIIEKLIDKPVMTVDAVTKLYLEDNMSMSDVANHFGVTKSAVNNFVYNNHLSKKSYSKPDGFRDKVVEQKRRERP